MPQAKPKPRNAHVTLRRKLENVKVMIPDTDWAKVICGEKRMFRSYSRRVTPPILPTAFIGYRFRIDDSLDTKVMWLEGTWQEPLGSITAEDLADEGFASLAEFRRYITERYPKGGYRPLATVQVYRVRPITDEDLDEFGRRLVREMGYAS